MERLRVIESEISKTQRDLENANESLQVCQLENTSLVTERDLANIEVERAYSNLESCKDKLFRMQPRDHTPDSQVSSQYSLLCEAIGDWAEQFGDLENPLEAVRRFKWGPIQEDMIVKYLATDGYLDIIDNYPKAGILVAGYFMLRHMYHVALDPEKHYPGMPEVYEGFLSALECGMKNLEPRRGKFA